MSQSDVIQCSARIKEKKKESLFFERSHQAQVKEFCCDYVQVILHGGHSEYMTLEAAIYTNNGSNDAVMAPKHNFISNIFNIGVDGLMGLFGCKIRPRSATEDNDFYRDYAQYMPGYKINGIPSGAWAQNAATNHLKHGITWDNIRRSLVLQQKSMIDASLAAGKTGQLSFKDLYRAHKNAYDENADANGFIDPGSFALAVYGLPVLEAVGINSGLITGASIYIFNNPDDSTTQGWAKRMGLAVSLILIGGGLSLNGGGNIATGNIIASGAEVLGGLGMVGLGGFIAGWNTVMAIVSGMFGK
jgi:hypothetical protein